MHTVLHHTNEYATDVFLPALMIPIGANDTSDEGPESYRWTERTGDADEYEQGRGRSSFSVSCTI